MQLDFGGPFWVHTTVKNQQSGSRSHILRWDELYVSIAPNKFGQIRLNLRIRSGEDIGCEDISDDICISLRGLMRNLLSEVPNIHGSRNLEYLNLFPPPLTWIQTDQFFKLNSRNMSQDIVQDLQLLTAHEHVQCIASANNYAAQTRVKMDEYIADLAANSPT